jgi:hypothetical protein
MRTVWDGITSGSAADDDNDVSTVTINGAVEGSLEGRSIATVTSGSTTIILGCP